MDMILPFLECTVKSSWYSSINFPINPMNAWPISLWNVAPSFFKPKGILAYVCVSQGVINDVFALSSSATKTWLYPEKPSNIDMQVDPVTCWRRNYILGKGKLSFMIALLRYLKSTHIRISLVFFLTITWFERLW